MKHIKENKQKYIVIAICVTLLLLMGIAIFQVLAPNNNTYGNRIDDPVEIDNGAMAKIKDELIEGEKANDVTYLNNVKVIKFFIDTDLSSKDVNGISTIILNNLSEKVVNFYDIEVYVTNSDSVDFPLIGYHSKNATEFSWVLNKVVETSEE